MQFKTLMRRKYKEAGNQKEDFHRTDSMFYSSNKLALFNQTLPEDTEPPSAPII